MTNIPLQQNSKQNKNTKKNTSFAIIKQHILSKICFLFKYVQKYKTWQYNLSPSQVTFTSDEVDLI
jgi:hypothetical protein